MPVNNFPTLNFSSPCRVPLYQSLPLSNANGSPCVWKARIEGEQWAGPAQLTVPPRDTINYTLTFKSSLIQQCKGRLTLINKQTGEEVILLLSGETTEPTPEELLTIQAQARQRTHHSLTLYNDLNTMVDYQVDCDLVCLSGQSSVRVPPQSSCVYPFSVCPPTSGVFPASLAFNAIYDGKKIQRWFVIVVNVSSPPSQDTLTLTCATHTTVTADIHILNPSQTEEVTFFVERQGKQLNGDDTLTLPAGQSAIYQLTFSPRLQGQSSGRLSFLHPTYGEYVYALDLTASPAPVIELESLKVELGSTASVRFHVSNPIDKTIRMKVKLTDETAFECKPASVIIPPLGVLPIQLCYTPTQMHVWQECLLTFRHELAGETQYNIKCMGTAPLTPQPVTKFSSSAGHATERTITFRNPFTSANTFTFKLQTENNNNTLTEKEEKTQITPDSSPFSVLHTHLRDQSSSIWRQLIPALTSVSIPISFTPPFIQNYDATLLVTDEEHRVQWYYPLHGEGEALMLSNVLTFTSRAKQQLVCMKTLTLPQYHQQPTHINSQSEAFQVQVEYNDDVSAAVKESLTATVSPMLLPLSTDSSNSSNHHQLCIDFIFCPLRPFTEDAALVISKASGGTWRYPVRLIAAQPVPDDEIRFQAIVGSKQAICFTLKNIRDRAAKYKAFLTTDSSPFFTVAPKTGRLPPTSANAGVPLTVTFAPLSYGREVCEATLKVETDECVFCYTLLGSHPKYSAPKPSHGRLHTTVAQSLSTAGVTDTV